MHVAALSRERTNYSLRRFRETAPDMGLRWSRIDPSTCDLMLGRKGRDILSGGRPIPRIDVAITRRGAAIEDLEITMINQLEHMGVPVLNGTHALLVSRDKYWSLRRLSDHGLPVPKTVVLHEPRNIERVYDLLGDPPIILKVLRGMRGTGVMIADTRQSVRSILDAFAAKGERLLAQEYIRESEGSDIRVLVVGGKVVAAMRRTAAVGEFRSNIHRGGAAEPVTLEPRAKEIARKAARIIGLDIAGVDLLESRDGPKIMEINSSPGFDGLEQATGMDIARHILTHAVRVARGEAKPMAPRFLAPTSAGARTP